MRACEKWAAHKPRAGQTVLYSDPDARPPINWTGKIVRVEHERAWVDYGTAGEEGSGLERFTWCFREKLNSLHDWPTKAGRCDLCGDPAITELDGDNLCQSHADAWVQGERDAA